MILRNKTKQTPRNYDGTRVTTHKVGDLLGAVLSKISVAHNDRPDLIMNAWPEIIGSKLAPMTQAISLCDGVLTVNVKNSTLHSLLSRHDKNRILSAIKQRFPTANIRNIMFRIA